MRLVSSEKDRDEYFVYMIECQDPKACTILLRGASKDVLNEMERNLQDAFSVARNLLLEPKLLPGGGATEMELAARLKEKAKSIEGVRQYAYRAVADALEVIPRSLAHNCGADVVRTITDLRARHGVAGQGKNFGLDGNKGTVVDTMEIGVLDSFVVKSQTIKTAVECAAMLLRIDDIVSGMSKKKRGNDGVPTQRAVDDADPEAFGDARDG